MYIHKSKGQYKDRLVGLSPFGDNLPLRIAVLLTSERTALPH